MPAVRILGPLLVQGINGRAALGGTKPRRLLAALALHVGETISASRLIDIIWADSPPRSARENLQTYLWALRRSLKAAGCPGVIIEAQPPGYRLCAPLDGLDWQRFASLSSEAGRCLATDPATAATLLREALDLWRGPVLSDLADGLPLLRGRIAAVDEARLTALEQRIQADLAVGHCLGLVAELGELVFEYPLREQFTGHQMVALYRCGRQAEALSVFRHARAQLAREFGIDPSPDLRRLYDAILRHDPSLDVRSPARHTRSVAAS